MNRAELQDSARKTFGGGGIMPDPAASWAKLTEMGWFMMTVPENRGGLGLGREALAAVHYELGRALVPGPAIAQMVAIEALAATGQGRLLEAAMAGELVTCSLEHLPFCREGEVEVGPVGTRNGAEEQAAPPAQALTGRGERAGFPDADLASHVLIATPHGIELADRFNATHRPSWDETRRLFDVEISSEAITMAVGQTAQALIDQLQSTLLLALAADSLGAAGAVLEMSVEHLKTRRQFDRPLALFQALKHRAADMQTWLAGAEALLWSRANDTATLTELGALKALACRAACRVAEEAVQLHGGIGLTQEHPCHRYLKRIMLNAALGGDADYWNEIAGRIALAAALDRDGITQ